MAIGPASIRKGEFKTRVRAPNFDSQAGIRM
jgi:hypothetical protein